MKYSATPGKKFAVCVDDDGYEASLERNKIHVVLPDKDAARDRDLRVIDESGEDYLFSVIASSPSTSLRLSKPRFESVTTTAR